MNKVDLDDSAYMYFYVKFNSKANLLAATAVLYSFENFLEGFFSLFGARNLYDRGS